nr:polysaccharide pyruvyl transferase family protein [uncultured Bacteroides sp.]
MKKVALVICYFQHNYGSQLQALATQMICDKLEIENETICIDGLKAEINKAKYRYFLSRIFDMNTIKDKMSTVRKLIAKRRNAEYKKNLAKRDALFTQFANEHFYLSRLYHSKAELGKHAHEYSAFVVGSDQLWLPSNIAANYYTLNFVPDDIKKVAYATSFGVSRLPKRQAKAAKFFLNRLDDIYVRETSGQKLIKELTGKDVRMICDPTLLFSAEEWNTIIPKERKIKEKYVLCYFLGNNPLHRKWAKQLSAATGYKIVQLMHLDEYIKRDEGVADYPLYEVGSLEFVGLIRDAEYVLTDSFHCTIFSTLFRKQFFSFRRYSNDSAVSTNSRLYSLLDTLGMSERVLRGNEMIEDSISLSVDWNQVHQRVANLKTESIHLLENALMPR